jgi:cell division transport system permease protein
MRTKLFVGEALASIRANLSTTVAATMTVLIGMFLLGLFIALGSWVLSWTDNVKKDVLVKVFFEPDASVREINALGRELQAMPEVRSITFVSRNEALQRMKERYPELTESLASNPLPPAFEITPVDADRVETIAQRIDPAAAGVDKVDYQKKETDRVLQVARIIGLIFLVGSVILLVASTMLIANTIRLSIFSRRREIEVMKLVGATNWFVRGPFMLEGLLCGLVGSISAVILLLLAKELALPVIRGRFETEPGVEALAFPVIALVLVVVSLLVGAAGSGITLRRFLRV